MGWRDDPVIDQTTASPQGASGPGAGQPAWQADEILSEAPRINFDRPVEQVRADIAKLPEAQREGALRAWGDRFVAKERAAGGAGQVVSDRVRNMVRGVQGFLPGSWIDEANAVTAAGLHRVTGGRAGAPYDETMAYQQATDRALDSEAAKLFRVPGTNVYITTADLEKFAGGVASIPAAPIAHVFRGATMLPQMGNAAIAGIGYGAAYGAGLGDTQDGRAWETAKGAGVGGLLGPASVPLARGASNALGYAAERMRPVPPALQGYERGAVNALVRSTTDDALAPRYAQQAADLGPEGMLADMGGNLRGQASALANQPGPGQQRIIEALNNRREGAAGRITADVDQALGPAANIPETVHATQQHYRAQAAPHRQQFQNNPVPFTQQLDDTLQMLAQNEPGVIREARRYANLDHAAGPQQFFARQLPDGSFEITRVPNAAEWDYLKRALDGMANGRTASANDQRIYGHLARQLRTQVDEAISPGAPDQSPWAQARRLEAEDFQIRDAIDQGRGAFSRDTTPDQMRADLYGVGQPPRGGMSAAEQAGYGVGARDQVRGIMGTAATAHGENAAAAARSRLGSDYAREKLDIIAGPQAAGQLTRRLDAETAFDQTRQGVLANSATAGRLAAQGEFPNPVAATQRSDIRRQASATGVAYDWTARFINAVSGPTFTEGRMRVARDAAEMLIQQGQARDNVANALFALSQRRNLSRANRQRFVRLAVQVAEGGRGAVIDARAAEPTASSPVPYQQAAGRNALDIPPPSYLPPDALPSDRTNALMNVPSSYPY